jgi:carboxyl-terminal processing protease
MPNRSSTLAALTMGALLGLSGAAANDLPKSAVQNVQQPSLSWEQARLFAEVYERIKREYVDTIDDRELMEKAVRGMVAGLDPYSAFLNNEEFDDIRMSTSGSYPGVGIEVVTENSQVKVLRPIQGSPAEQAGMRSGDLIVKIDNSEIDADLTAAINRMRGPAGSVVRLTVRRPSSGELLDFSLRRATVEVHSVLQQTLEPGIGYLRITSFSDTTAQDLQQAVADLKQNNPRGIQGMVLDLRNNPGGVLEAGVAVADAFLDHGLIVSAEGRSPEAHFSMAASQAWWCW